MVTRHMTKQFQSSTLNFHVYMSQEFGGVRTGLASALLELGGGHIPLPMAYRFVADVGIHVKLSKQLRNWSHRFV